MRRTVLVLLAVALLCCLQPSSAETFHSLVMKVAHHPMLQALRSTPTAAHEAQSPSIPEAIPAAATPAGAEAVKSVDATEAAPKHHFLPKVTGAYLSAGGLLAIIVIGSIIVCCYFALAASRTHRKYYYGQTGWGQPVFGGGYGGGYGGGGLGGGGGEAGCCAACLAGFCCAELCCTNNINF